jgi:hypothetical protein
MQYRAARLLVLAATTAACTGRHHENGGQTATLDGSGGAGGDEDGRGGEGGDGGNVGAAPDGGKECPTGQGGHGGAVRSCVGDGDCDGGSRCVAFLPGYRLCSRAEPADVQTSCRPRPIPDTRYAEDECGCPGRTCPAGQECRRQEVDLGAASGEPLFRNVCGTDACQTAADCGPGRVCVPPFSGTFTAFNTCVDASCTSQDECSACGACAPVTDRGAQGRQVFVAVRCAY